MLRVSLRAHGVRPRERPAAAGVCSERTRGILARRRPQTRRTRSRAAAPSRSSATMTPMLSMRRNGAEGEQVRERKRAEHMTEDSKQPVLRLRDQPRRVREDERTRRIASITTACGSSPRMKRDVLMGQGKNKTCTESSERSATSGGMVNCRAPSKRKRCLWVSFRITLRWTNDGRKLAEKLESCDFWCEHFSTSRFELVCSPGGRSERQYSQALRQGQSN